MYDPEWPTKTDRFQDFIAIMQLYQTQQQVVKVLNLFYFTFSTLLSNAYTKVIITESSSSLFFHCLY